MLAILLVLAAHARGPVPVGAGVLFQGIRPGAVVELPLPLATRTDDDRRTRHLFVPTLSGWVHPGHYLPIQLHGHYAFEQRLDAFLVESAVGIGTTWVANARPTVRLEGDEVVRVPLAGRMTLSPAVGIGLGHAGRRVDTLFRVRLNLWLPWQQSVALSGNYELVFRPHREENP